MEMALQDEFYADSVSFSKFNDSVLKSTIWFNQKSSTYAFCRAFISFFFAFLMWNIQT